MNLAFLISAHTDPLHLERLINSLPGDAEFFIHIDKKSNLSQFTSLISGENIHFIGKRINVRWGTINEVDYQMNLIEAAIMHVKHFDRIFFLSGLDYPIWSNGHLLSYLEENSGKEILIGIPLIEGLIGKGQFDTYSIIRPFINIPLIGNALNQKLSIASRIILKALGFKKALHFNISGKCWPIYKGGAWWCISEELAHHVFDTYVQHPAIRRYFKHQFCPAETLIQTVAFNSPEYKDKCCLFYTPYQSLSLLTPLHYIDYGKQVKILTEEDFDKIMNSGKAFARKFKTGDSDRLMDMIDSYRTVGCR